MKLTFLLVALSLFAAGSGAAQEKRDTIHHPSATQKKTKLKDELGLNKTQTKELKASQKDYKQKVQEVKSDTTLSKKDQKVKMKKLKQEKQQKTDAVLTPEQKEKAKQLRKEKKDKKKENKTGK
jgi:periplasmic protein CpxP/Spy